MARHSAIIGVWRAALVAAGVAFAAMAQAADPPRAGHIDNFEGPPGSFVLLRGPADAPRKMPVERYMKLLAPRWQMMSDPQLTGYFANFMVEVSREYEDPAKDEVEA